LRVEEMLLSPVSGSIDIITRAAK